MAPLDGIKVIDFTHLLPGELCSTALSDLGCAVLRIEPLTATLGQMLPPIIDGHSLYFWSLHRNKQRISVDLKRADGVKIARRVIKDADVLIENFRPGVMDRLGLGYKEMSALNPGLIYCSISGYGQSGSWSEKPGHDLNLIAESGVLAMNARDGEKPILPSVLVSDYTSAMYAAIRITSQLYERHRTNAGVHIDVSMFESALSTMGIMGTALLYEELHPELGHYEYPRELPNYTVYECSDHRYLAVAALEAPFWKTFCEKAGIPELADKVVKSVDQEISNKIAAVIRQKPLHEWISVFENTNCCVSPVSTIAEALRHPPVQEHGIVHHMSHPILGDVPQVSSPLSESMAASTAYDDRAEQSASVLSELGYSIEQIGQLKLEKVIL
ncbi:MAG: CaiB/BaiF CoA-transferase family protein [Candidatus Obscuribacterales bacterium]